MIDIKDAMVRALTPLIQQCHATVIDVETRTLVICGKPLDHVGHHERVIDGAIWSWSGDATPVKALVPFEKLQ